MYSRLYERTIILLIQLLYLIAGSEDAVTYSTMAVSLEL